MYAYVLKKIKKISAIERKMKYKDNYCPARFGGRSNDDAGAGLFYVSLRYDYPLSYSYNSYGASLSCKPL